MKPQQVNTTHGKPPDQCVELPTEADPRAVHVLLTRVEHGTLGWHRAGYLTLDDGLTPAPFGMAWGASLLEATGHIMRIPDGRGNHFVVLSPMGTELLARLDAEIFGGGR